MGPVLAVDPCYAAMMKAEACAHARFPIKRITEISILQNKKENDPLYST